MFIKELFKKSLFFKQPNKAKEKMPRTSPEQKFSFQTIVAYTVFFHEWTMDIKTDLCTDHCLAYVIYPNNRGCKKLIEAFANNYYASN